jgi:hypothetical protein
MRHRKRAAQIKSGKAKLRFLGRSGSDLNDRLIAAHLQAARTFDEKAEALEATP